jgi:iron(III) transport system permease protein
MKAISQAQTFQFRVNPPALSVLYGMALVLVFALVLAPVLFLVVNSFQLASPGQEPIWGIRTWQTTLARTDVWLAMWNSVRLYLATSMISWPSAILLAWIIGRTDIPKTNWIEFFFWLSFFLPSLTVVMGWITLLDPGTGLINQFTRWLFLIDRETGPFNVYTFWGLVWVHLGQNAIALKTILLIPAFRNLDAAMEEASRLSGAGVFGTLRNVVMPLMIPSIVVTALLGFVRLWQSFETELVLGVPQGFYVYGTKIYDFLNHEVPQYGEATVLAVSVILLTFPLMILQRRYSVRRNYETVSGRYKLNPTPLGRAKWPVFFVVMGVALFVSIVPVISVIMGTFMKIFGYFNIEQPWTLNHWKRVLNDPVFLLAVRNTFLVAGGAAALGAAITALIAYILVRTHFRLRGFLDVMTWLPHALPGMLMGLGVLWVTLTVLKPLYGSISLLILVVVASGMTVGVQIIKSNIVQFSPELEEASWLSGASWFYTMRRVVLPPLAPVLVLIATVNFVSASRDVSSIILLASGDSMTLALLQLDYMVAPYWESATVVAVVMTLISTGLALVARGFGVRLGIR